MTEFEEFEAIRQDILRERYEELNHEYAMRTDVDYFYSKCGVEGIAEQLRDIYRYCNLYNYDFEEVIKDML